MRDTGRGAVTVRGRSRGAFARVGGRWGLGTRHPPRQGRRPWGAGRPGRAEEVTAEPAEGAVSPSPGRDVPRTLHVNVLPEGRGFAFRRKLKIQQHYKKLLWREKKARTTQESQFRDRFPDHLKHLYLAEEERLRKQLRKADQPLSDEQVNQDLPEEECDTGQVLSEEHCSIEQPQPEQEYKEEKANSITIPKKNKKKTSNQKAQEEYEQVQAKRAAKKQEFERRKQEREEAQRLYKKKKMEVFKILSKKTKKGQPNLNLQMEYLLKKIQEKN